MEMLSSDTKPPRAADPSPDNSPFLELFTATWMEAAYSVTIFSSRDTFARMVQGQSI
jgi:hypothetical protein